MNVTIHYPLQKQQRIVLRSDHNWEENISPTSQSQDSTSFVLPKDTLYWKPCLFDHNNVFWAKSANQIAVQNNQHTWPYFFQSKGIISPKYSFSTEQGEVSHLIRVYTPPSYNENTLKRYPVLYMHDGGNVFFSEEAFMGVEWRADETMDILNRMNIIEEVIVVAVYPRNRMKEYTQQAN
jgi:enterochelin esterase-like enzyme